MSAYVKYLLVSVLGLMFFSVSAAAVCAHERVAELLAVSIISEASIVSGIHAGAGDICCDSVVCKQTAPQTRVLASLAGPWATPGKTLQAVALRHDRPAVWAPVSDDAYFPSPVQQGVRLLI
jgi:hypothetical protein